MVSSSKGILRQSAVILALVATIGMNTLANILPLAGRSTGEISDSFQVLFTPADYVFSIWGLIYLALIVYAVYQGLPSQRHNPRLERTGYLFVLSCVLNVAWLLAWHNLLIPLSLVLMVCLLGTLITLYERLGTGRFAVPTAERWAVRVPFSLYLGWITVATVANAGVAFYNAGWREGAAFWTAVAILVATAVTLTIIARRRDYVFGLVVIWAFVGIAVKHPDITLVVSSALAGVFCVEAWALYRGVEMKPPGGNRALG